MRNLENIGKDEGEVEVVIIGGGVSKNAMICLPDCCFTCARCETIEFCRPDCYSAVFLQVPQVLRTFALLIVP